jgi:exopolysaccharide biosynthesis protein
MRLVVTKVDTGVVAIPENGFVISLGSDAEWLTTVQPGDTVRLHYKLSSNSSKKVRDAITSTPRIVRDGIPGPEHPIEGSKARRFVEGKLSRSAVGISQGGDTLFLATVDSPHKEANTTGMTLRELAEFMASIGAYQALNLDGGGSATMVVNGETISRQGGRPFNRRVSNALIVVKPAPQAPSAPRSSRN